MFELIVLEEYRHALAVLAKRARQRKCFGLRFSNIDYFSYFQVPTVYGGTGLIYMKMDERAACAWSTSDGRQLWSFTGENSSLRFMSTLPVVKCRPELAPPA